MLEPRPQLLEQLDESSSGHCDISQPLLAAFTEKPWSHVQLPDPVACECAAHELVAALLHVLHVLGQTLRTAAPCCAL